MEKIGLWTSGGGQTSIELVQEVYRSFSSKTSYVFLSQEGGETYYGDLMIQKVRELGLSLITFSSLKFKPELRKNDKEAWRLEHDQEVIKLLPPSDLIVLLGYMWVVGKEMCQKQTIINLHPALPNGPKGTYRKVIRQLIRERATETGVTIHLVTPELDEGPPITFCHFPIRGKDFDYLWKSKEGDSPLFRLIRERGVIREFPMVIWTIKELVEGRIKIKNGQVITSEGQIIEEGYDLTSEIDAMMKYEK